MPCPDPSTTVVLVCGGTELATWPLEARLEAPFQAGFGADMSVVDDLARLQLAARRVGCSIRLRNPSPRLCQLLALAGLARAVTTPDGELVVEVGGEPEDSEDAGVEEGVEGGDFPT